MKVSFKNLRIGNKLQKDNGEIFTVLRLDNSSDILVEEERGLLTLNYNLFGIPLWDGILIKSGFIDKGTCFNYDRSEELGHPFGDFAISKYDDTQVKLWRGDRYCGIVHCQYFHELQNLMFVLSDYELSLS